MAFQICYTLMTLLCENKDKTNTNKNAYLNP
ncbi:unknown [Bacteroides sp. CAG:702]|nr:unknown [Bacteroides sp. CAG:702]